MEYFRFDIEMNIVSFVEDRKGWNAMIADVCNRPDDDGDDDFDDDDDDDDCDNDDDDDDDDADVDEDVSFEMKSGSGDVSSLLPKLTKICILKINLTTSDNMNV